MNKARAILKPDGPIEMDYYFWVLRSADTLRLVDCGFDPDAGRRRGRTLLIDPIEALSRLAIAPEDVREIIVSHAHYDHIGVLGAEGTDRIFNGANDDGSGTVSVIEIASALATLKERPKRSILFVTFFGEEKGLLGSEYYAHHPLVPLGKTALDLNFDMILPLGVPESIVVTGAERITAWPAVKAIAKLGFDTIFLPEGGTMLRSLGPILTINGVDSRKIQLLGTGSWDDDPAVAREPSLIGGWYAVPPQEQRANFRTRFQQLYGTKPARIASLAYDAVALSATLAGGQPGKRYTRTAIADPNGFAGIDGIFRFRSDGTNDRGLAVLRVASGGPQTIAPAPKSFGGSPAG